MCTRNELENAKVKESSYNNIEGFCIPELPTTAFKLWLLCKHGYFTGLGF